MSDRRFILIMIDSKNLLQSRNLTKILDRASDWVEFYPNNWLLWTKSDTKIWYNRIKPILKDGDKIIICEANMSERAGLMPSSFWHFINSKKTENQK